MSRCSCIVIFFPQSPCSVSLCSFVLLSFLYLWIQPLFHSSTFNQFFFDTHVPYQPPKPGHSKCFLASLLFLLSRHLIFFTWASTPSLSPVNHLLTPLSSYPFCLRVFVSLSLLQYFKLAPRCWILFLLHTTQDYGYRRSPSCIPMQRIYGST